MEEKLKTLSDIEKFCLDSYLVNGNDDMAYILSRDKPPTATQENIHRLALRWLRSDPVKAYLKERRAVIYSRTEKGIRYG